MSVAQQTPYNVAAGNAASTVFPFTWQALQAADIGVYIDGSPKTLNVDYTVTGTGALNGGNVTFVTPPAAGTRVTLTRQMIKYRPTDYQQVGDFQTAVVNPDIDRAILITQELAAADSRSIRVAPYEQASNMLLPPIATRKNSFLYCDVNGDLAVAVALASGTLSQSSIGGFLTPQTDAEIAVGVVPVKTWYQEGEIRRYGAFLDGIIDDTVAVQNWAKVAGMLSWPVAKNAKISGEITISSNTSITAAMGATITQSAADLSTFRSTTTSNVNIRGLHFKQTTQGAAAYVAHVVFDGVSYGSVNQCEFEGHQWRGVYLRAARHCTVRGNHFHDANPQVSLTFTAGVASGASSATLSAPWAKPSGGYTVAFTETAGGAIEGRQVTFVNGLTTANWAGGGGNLAANCNAGFTVQCATEASDIGLDSSPVASASFNIIDGNFCYGSTLQIGISIEDPYAGVLSTRNIVSNNRITVHLGYGILSYQPDAGDSYNQFIGNFIENISGLFALNQSSGAGIYLTGSGIGGSVVANNTIRNCCINTANASLAPAAIGIAGNPATTGGAPLTITGNTITDMSQYHGILITGLLNGAEVRGNSIRMPSTNVNGHAVTITNSDGIGCSNTIYVATGTAAIRGYLIQALGGVNCTNISIAGGSVRGGHFAQIETVGTGGGLVVGLSVTGVTLDQGDASCVCLQLGSATDVTVSGNFMRAATNFVINQSSCLNVTYTGNRFKGSTTVIQLVGTNTGTFVDESNTGIAATSINNAGTGAVVHWFGSGAPATGTWALGDEQTERPALVGAGIYKRICTTAGTGGGAVFRTISDV